jgi:Flp pilus assembly protein TadD
MRRLFTKVIGASVLGLIMTGCANLSVPVPFTGGGVNKTERGSEQVESPDERAGFSSAAMHGAIEVEVPDLDAGTLEQFQRSSALLEVGQPDSALVLLKKLTLSQPELAGPWVNTGVAYLQLDDESSATDAFNKALAANPHNCEALIQLGVLARKRGAFDMAEELYGRCIAAQPGYADAHLNLAILYELYMGRLGEALAAYNEYQLALVEPDTTVNGWMMDLERRAASVAQR